MGNTDALTVDLVSETTREGGKQWRSEIRLDGVLIDSSLPTVHPRAAIADGEALLHQHRDGQLPGLPDYLPSWRLAQRQFAA